MASKTRSHNKRSSSTPVIEDPSASFVHRWNDLVSTTNWEKGRIIHEWREALVASGAAAGEYADETWAERVGNVTGQHVGRLRRAYERFGPVSPQYPGLYWSHFQVALDWEDAEMWLEGAVQNDWSVSQMRSTRWETLGAPESLKPRDEDVFLAELDEDADARLDETLSTASRMSPFHPADDEVADAENHDGHTSSDEHDGSAAEDDVDSLPATSTAAEHRPRPFENLPSLPDDVAEAFEQFKLVILTHKLSGWTQISRDDLLHTLDSLKVLVLQPAGE